MQDADCPADVEAFSLPAGHRRACVDVQTADIMLRSHSRSRIGGNRRQHGALGEELSVRPPETELSIRPSFYLRNLFLDRAAMCATEHFEIRQWRRASMRPL